MPGMSDEFLREEILRMVALYGDRTARTRSFVPGETFIPASGKVIGAKELQLLVEASLDGWLTSGRFNEAFEHRLAGASEVLISSQNRWALLHEVREGG